MNGVVDETVRRANGRWMNRGTDSHAGISNEVMRAVQLWHCRGRLTIDAERHPGLQFASLGHGPVPHDAAVRGPVVTAGWRQRQDGRGDGVSRIARASLCLQRVGIALLVPPAHKAYCYIPHNTEQSAGENMEQTGS